jgi:hypothetical protein
MIVLDGIAFFSHPAIALSSYLISDSLASIIAGMLSFAVSFHLFGAKLLHAIYLKGKKKNEYKHLPL